MIADAEAWLTACQGMLTNDGSQPFLYPHFPGFNSNSSFQCEIVFGDAWRESIKDSAMSSASKVLDFTDRLRRVIDLYKGALEVLSARDPRPNVVLCCIPQQIIDTCTSQRRAPKRVITRSRRTTRMLNQLDLFASFGMEEEEAVHENLRRGLKAEAMQFSLPTQLVWPRTLQIAAPSDGGIRRTQDISTRAWNFTTALYHKAGGSPWRLAELEPGVCFVGLSFYREIVANQPGMRSSMAQAFTAAGDGYVLRGGTFEWNEGEHGRSPHLSKDLAAGLLRDVIDMYKRQNRGSLPTRLVIHKSSRFWEDELAGLEEASESVPRKDFVALGTRGIQFYRKGDYPPLRGTYVKFSDSDLLLYTSGYVPFLRTYPGPRVPRPLEVLEHFGDSPWDLVLREIMALTKMNWNTADFACSDPITIAFSRRVGQILAELPQNARVQPEYRYYM
jgi:hypothetical protein